MTSSGKGITLLWELRRGLCFSLDACDSLEQLRAWPHSLDVVDAHLSAALRVLDRLLEEESKRAQ
jgi:hypothetical protein